LWKSTDGGSTWRQLTNGLPTGLIGRIGISIARSAPRTVYAVVENANSRVEKDPEERRRRMARASAAGRSATSCTGRTTPGATWRKVSPPEAGGGAGPGGRGGWTGGNPPYWYGQIRVNPNDPEHVYLLSVGVTHTTDGGKTWSSPFPFGGDNHAMWINPATATTSSSATTTAWA
jgi:hypothetical protein